MKTNRTIVLVALSMSALMGVGGCDRHPSSAGADVVAQAAGPGKFHVAGEVDGLRLVEPGSARDVAPGEQIRIAVETRNGFKPHDGVLVATGWSTALLKEPPYSTVMTVPPEVIGPFNVSAMAFDKNRYVAATKMVTMNSKTSSAIVGLEIRPDIVGVTMSSPDRRISVDGRFADGVRRHLDSALWNLNFSVADATIATADAHGNVHGLRAGQTKLRVKVGEVVGEAPLIVFGN
jgi:hypothetical protein